MPLSNVKYRFKKGTKVRLAFRGSEVVEAKNVATGATHTESEFATKARRRLRAHRALRGKR